MEADRCFLLGKAGKGDPKRLKAAKNAFYLAKKILRVFSTNDIRFL